MGYKIIRANNQNPIEPQDTGIASSNNSYKGANGILGWAGQQVAGAAARVAELPGVYKGQLEQLASQAQSPVQSSFLDLPQQQDQSQQPKKNIFPGSQDIRRSLEKTIGTQEGYLDPRGIVGDAVEMTVNALPLTLLLGSGALPARIAQDFTSSLAASTAKAAKLPAAAQIASGLLINPALGGAKRGIQNLFKAKDKKLINPLGLEAVGNEVLQKYSTQRDKLAPKAIVDANSYERKLDKIGNEIADHAFQDTAEKTKLSEFINNLKGDIKNNKISGDSIIKRKEQWNSVYPELKRQGKNYQNFSERIKGVIEDTREEIGKNYPTWYKATKVVDDITKAKNLSFNAENLLDGFPKAQKYLSNPLIQGILSGGAGALGGGAGGLGALAGGLIGGGTLAAGKFIAPKASKIIGFLKEPGARQVTEKVVKSIIQEKTPELIRNLSKLDGMTKKYEKKSVNKNPSSQKTSYRIIRANSSR